MVKNQVSKQGIKIKEFLETNYPQDRATGVFRWFHFDLRSKTEILLFEIPKQVRDDVFGDSDAELRSILFE